MWNSRARQRKPKLWHDGKVLEENLNTRPCFHFTRELKPFPAEFVLAGGKPKLWWKAKFTGGKWWEGSRGDGEMRKGSRQVPVMCMGHVMGPFCTTQNPRWLATSNSDALFLPGSPIALGATALEFAVIVRILSCHDNMKCCDFRLLCQNEQLTCVLVIPLYCHCC